MSVVEHIAAGLLLCSSKSISTELLPDKSQISQPVLVCTAHIHWDPEFCDVKLIQVRVGVLSHLLTPCHQLVKFVVQEEFIKRF